jgi:hypothetical protein
MRFSETSALASEYRKAGLYNIAAFLENTDHITGEVFSFLIIFSAEEKMASAEVDDVFEYFSFLLDECYTETLTALPEALMLLDICCKDYTYLRQNSSSCH